MSKQHPATAVVFVDKGWYDNTLRFLLRTTKSASTVGVHLVQGPLKDAGNPIGLWLKGLTSTQLKTGREEVMDVMIPWSAVIALALINEPKPAAGFQVRDVRPD